MKDFLEVVGDEDDCYLQVEDYKCSLGQRLKRYMGQPMNGDTLNKMDEDIREFFNNAVLEENK